MPKRFRLSRDHPWNRPVLVWLAACLLCLSCFQLGSEALEREAITIDEAVLLGAAALRHAYPWLIEAMRDISGLGSTVSLSLLTVGTCGYIMLRSSVASAFALAGLVVASSVSVHVLKVGFARERPLVEHAAFAVPGFSFPSGHTTMSTVVFLILGTLIARLHSNRTERGYVLAFAVTLALLVGLSRAILGVHWASDVVGGWLFGAAWACLAAVLAPALGRRSLRPRPFA